MRIYELEKVSARGGADARKVRKKEILKNKEKAKNAVEEYEDEEEDKKLSNFNEVEKEEDKSLKSNNRNDINSIGEGEDEKETRNFKKDLRI